MKILLTPDQESTLWHLTQKVLTPKGESYYCFPYGLRIEGDGTFERIPLNNLPEDVKKNLSSISGLNLAPSEEETMHDWIMSHNNAIQEDICYYKFDYNGVKCAGVVSIFPMGNTLQIRPMNITHDIGLGAGQMETKYFKR